MQKTCTNSWCGRRFTVTDADLEFYDTVSPVFNGKKELIPSPRLCPDCRRQRRFLFRNLRNLYRRRCDLTGESLLTGYAPDAPLVVYRAKEWWGDQWDGLDYGRDFDFSKPFSEQFADLYRRVPVVHLYGTHLENCDYINGASKCKNCYLCFNLDYCEDGYFLADALHVKDSLDCLGVKNCELCYECTQCEDCYEVSHSLQCTQCKDSDLLFDCRRCTCCIACCNLVDKQYYIFNEQVTPAVFEVQRKFLLSPEHLMETIQKASAFQLQFPKKHYFGHSNEQSTGDNIHHTKNCIECFDGSEMEDCKYCHYNHNVKHCMDHTIFGDHSEWIYNCVATGTDCSNNSFCMYCWNGSSYNLYCHLVHGCANCFGCSGLKHQKYCILNKQYTKDEYETLVPNIIQRMKEDGEWGEFFLQDLSPFAYNETVANEYFPLSRAQAEERGYRWREDTSAIPQSTTMIPVEQLPSNIDDIPDDILNWALCCKATKRPFRIVKQELAFYRNHRIPIPHFHPDERHRQRMALRNPRKLWTRDCEKCKKTIQTSYAPERLEQVYCEECYLKEVY